MKLAKALNEKMMDVRLVDRLMAQGKMTKDEFDKNIAGLADDQANLEKVEDDSKTPASSAE